jgi:hypothetical protein
VWKQAAGLDDVTDLPAKLVPVHPGDVVTVDDDAALGRLDQSVDHLQGGGLAAT